MRKRLCLFRIFFIEIFIQHISSFLWFFNGINNNLIRQSFQMKNLVNSWNIISSYYFPYLITAHSSLNKNSPMKFILKNLKIDNFIHIWMFLFPNLNYLILGVKLNLLVSNRNKLLYLSFLFLLIRRVKFKFIFEFIFLIWRI